MIVLLTVMGIAGMMLMTPFLSKFDGFETKIKKTAKEKKKATQKYQEIRRK